MVEKTVRRRVEESDAESEDRWHVLVRESTDDAPRHVGSLVAADEDEAHETATRLFAWYAHEVWVCRVSDVARYVAAEDENQDGDGTPAIPGGGDEPRSYEETEVEGPE